MWSDIAWYSLHLNWPPSEARNAITEGDMSISLPRVQFSSVQFSLLSCVWLFATPWTAACQPSPSINSWSLLKLMSIESVVPSYHLVLFQALCLLPSIFHSIRVFSNESVLRIRWPKYWSFSFSISPSNEYSGLISFRVDWLDLLVVQGSLKNLLQHHSSKASILRCSCFFIVQLSHPYMTTGKTKALTRRTFVGKVMSLLFNMLSRLIITFLPRNKPHVNLGGHKHWVHNTCYRDGNLLKGILGDDTRQVLECLTKSYVLSWMSTIMSWVEKMRKACKISVPQQCVDPCSKWW